MILDHHRAIAWDWDGTLSGGANSERFRAYIAAHPEKRHHVITFRRRMSARLVWLELRRLGLDPRLIASVENCPEPLHDMFMLHASGEVKIPKHLVGRAIHAFQSWKGRRARELECTILVDDMADWVVVGCRENRVEFLDANAELV